MKISPSGISCDAAQKFNASLKCQSKDVKELYWLCIKYTGLKIAVTLHCSLFHLFEIYKSPLYLLLLNITILSH